MWQPEYISLFLEQKKKLTTFDPGKINEHFLADSLKVACKIHLFRHLSDYKKWNLFKVCEVAPIAYVCSSIQKRIAFETKYVG